MKKTFVLILFILSTIGLSAQCYQDVADNIYIGMTSNHLLKLFNQEPSHRKYKDKDGNVDQFSFSLKEKKTSFATEYRFYFVSDRLTKVKQYDTMSMQVFDIPINPKRPLSDSTYLYTEETAQSGDSTQHSMVVPPSVVPIEVPNLNIQKMYYNQRTPYGGNLSVNEIDWASGVVLSTRHEDYYLPYVVLDHYKFGKRCYKGGTILISVGAPLALIGGILAGVGAQNGDAVVSNAGYAISVLGGACVSVSIPLLCFGDNMKRDANREFRLFNTKR